MAEHRTPFAESVDTLLDRFQAIAKVADVSHFDSSSYSAMCLRASVPLNEAEALAEHLISRGDVGRAVALRREVTQLRDAIYGTGRSWSLGQTTGLGRPWTLAERQRYFREAAGGVVGLLKEVKSTLLADTSNGPWSTPQSPEEWSKVFKVGPRQFVRWCKKGKIRNKPISTKSYMVHLEDLPTTNRGGS